LGIEEPDHAHRSGRRIVTAKYASIDEFVSIVEWLIVQPDDAPQSRFSLFRVGFENPQLIGSRFGAQEGLRRLNQFGTTLASSVSRSDVVMRDLSVFWMLSPNHDVDFVRDRMGNIVRRIDEFGLDIVECHVKAHVFPHPQAIKVVDARLLLDRFEDLHDTHGLGTLRNPARTDPPKLRT
jgi:hypothetical protein